MQYASDRWLRFYRIVTTIFQGGLLVACVVGWFVPSLNQQFTSAGLSPVTFGIALIHVLYVLGMYPIFQKRNVLLATLVVSAIFTLNIVNLIHVTGQFQSLWMIAWGISCLMTGVFGGVVTAAAGFLITIYFVLLQDSSIRAASSVNIGPKELGLIFGTYVLCFLSWLLWKRAYVDTNTLQVKQLTGQLNSKQQVSESLIHSITDGIIVVDITGKITVVNTAASDMTGWPIEEASGIDVRLVVKLLEEDGKDLEAQIDPFSQVLTQKQLVNQTLQLVGRNNKKQIVSLVISPILAGKSQEISGAVAVMRDVSLARAEEHRRADFISTASHEMRTPVAAIEGYLALALNDKVSQIDMKARSYLEKAHASTQHLGKLFQDLLTSAKAEDGRLVSHPEVIEMGAYTEQIADSLRFTAEKKGLMVDFIIGSSGADAAGGKVVKPLYYAHVDPDRMREVITNLFDNAVKYTETGKVSIALTGNTDVIQLYIKDTGPGIAAEDVPHLFQKFYRVDNSATRTIGGTGLGLFICRKIVELYNGRIWVESEVGKGSTFYINVPRLSSQKATELQAQAAATNSALQ